jgi:hypothetical protein
MPKYFVYIQLLCNLTSLNNTPYVQVCSGDDDVTEEIPTFLDATHHLSCAIELTLLWINQLWPVNSLQTYHSHLRN